MFQKKEDEKIALNSMKILGIEYLKDKEYTNLSGGERQLVFLARVSLRIQTGVRLVTKEILRSQSNRTGNGSPFHHTTTNFAGILMSGIGKTPAQKYPPANYYQTHTHKS